MRHLPLTARTTWACPHAATAAALHAAYSHLSITLDDCAFHQSASHLLDAIHVALGADDLPPDLAHTYQELERATREQIRQRDVLPSRPLF